MVKKNNSKSKLFFTFVVRKNQSVEEVNLSIYSILSLFSLYGIDNIHLKPFGNISPESLKKVHGVLQEETNAFKNETRKCTFAELTRLKNAYGDEEDNIDVLRLRWWPHGYILVLILELLFSGNLLLILKLMGKL